MVKGLDLEHNIPRWLSGKEYAYNAGDGVRSLGQEDLLKKGMNTLQYSTFRGSGKEM